VRGRNGEPLRGARIVVWWQQIRERKELIGGETSEQGRYHLRYSFPEAAPPPLLVIVQALSEFLDAPLFSPLTAAQKILQIDLSLEPADESEWTTLVHAIQPFLGSLTLAGLVEDTSHQDLSFLSKELSKGTDVLMRVAVAARMEATFKIPAPVFYAFLRQQAPADLPSPLLDASQSFTLIDSLVQSLGAKIFAMPAQSQKQVLTAAVALSYISALFTKQIPQLVTQLQALHITGLLNQPYQVGSTTLGQLLTVATIPAEKQEAFAQALAANTQSMRSFWRTLGDGQHGLTAAEASAIERTLSIGAFVKNYLPLVQNLVQRFTSGTYKALADLARLSRQDWVRLVSQTGAPPNVDPAGTASSTEVFAAVIYTRVTRAYPTAALSSRIAGSTFIPAAQQQPVARFFQNNPDLELLNRNLAVYVANPDNNTFAGIASQDQPAVLSCARSMQRVLRVAPDPDTAEILLNAGLTSATQVAAMGRQLFFRKATAAGLTGTKANQAYDAAAQRYAAVVSLYMRMSRDSVGLWPAALGDRSAAEEAVQKAVQTDPTLATLFGTQDYCAAGDCTSILSPAAYLCDLLMWLRNHPQPSGTALDVLDGRRPDIRHLLLNCPNTDTELPYVDLVIELLADKVSPLPSTMLAADMQAADTSITVASSTGFPSPGFTVLIGTEILAVTAVSGVSWSVTRGVQGTDAASANSGTAIILTTTANPPWKQTPASATTAQLSAAPIYFNQGAFITLFSASYPRSLPYSAGLDELRTCLRQWNLPLWQLRQALLPLGGGSLEQQTAAAAERLGMNVHATDLVTTPNLVSASIAWNIADPATALTSVPAFLQAVSIDYESLLELLQVFWVVSGTSVALFGVNDSCDTSVQTLTPATTLTGDIDASQTTITVADGSDFPMPSFFAAIGAEIVQVTAVSGTNNTSWTVLRAQQGTSAATGASGATVVVPLDAGFLDRAHRFLRLWLSTGYKMWELDQLLSAASVGNNTLDEKALIALQAFWQLQRATSLSVDQQLAFYQDIDTAAHRDPNGSTTTSLYAQLFLNPTTTWLAADPDLAALPGGGAIGDPLLADHAKAIQPAFAMSASDLALLVSLTNNSLTLANLSTIYRINSLAGAARLSIADLLRLAQLLSPGTVAPATTLAADIAAAQSTITVADAAPFGAPNFYVVIGAETLLVTAKSGADNATWTVLRGQLGTTAAAAASGTTITGDTASPAAAAAALFGAPAATLTFLQQAVSIQQQAGLSLDAITYLLTPPSAITGRWTSTSQMTPASIAATLTAIQQALKALFSASTTLLTGISTIDTTITVASDAGFPAPNFSVYVGSEIMEVTATNGAGNSIWTVMRGQQGTVAAAASAGTAVTPTIGSLTGTLIAAVAANAHNAGSAPLAADVTATILQTLQVPGTSQTLAATLMDPALLSATGNITIGGAPVAGDILQAILNNGVVPSITVSYTLVNADAGSPNQTATDFANAINASTAVSGPQAFLAPCIVSGPVITLAPLAPGEPGSSIVCTSAASPGGAGHVIVSPTTTRTIGLPGFSNQVLAIRVLDKVAALVRGLRLVASDLAWLLANSGNPAVGGLDLTQLPVTPGQPALALTPLLNTLLLIKLARLWQAAPAAAPFRSLYEIVGGLIDGDLTDETTTQTALATITGWPLSDIESFAAALGAVFPSSYQTPTTYDRLRTLEAMSAAVDASGPVVSGAGTTLSAAITASQTPITVTSAIGFPGPSFYVGIGTEILLVTAMGGADNTSWSVQRGQLGTTPANAPAGAAVTQTFGAQIVSWGSAPGDETAAESMAASALGLLKAQQPSEQAWLSVAPGIMDPIRQNQSAALQAYLTAQRDATGALIYGDTNALFDYFLIDTQMTACQVTSRVVQAYIAIQIFVERCLMNLEAPAVVVDLNQDDTWKQWQWMSRFRIWQANREVFLYPENWLIESQRPNRTENYQTFEQEVRQAESTADYLQTVVLNYIDRLEAVSHLLIAGTCEDQSTGAIYVVARTAADPPVFFIRSYDTAAWSGWSQIPLNIKAHQVVPALYGGRVCLFWVDLKLSSEPHQSIGPPETSSVAPEQTVNQYATLGLNFSVFRNGNWSAAQSATGSLFDRPPINSSSVADPKSVEALYTIRVQTPASAPGYGASLFVDVFRLGNMTGGSYFGSWEITSYDPSTAVHLGRAVFNGRFTDLELRNLLVFDGIPPATVSYEDAEQLWTHAKLTYGPSAQPLLLLPDAQADPNLQSDSGLTWHAGALSAFPSYSGGGATSITLAFSSVGELLGTAPLPVRVVGPDTNVAFDPAAYFFYQDSRRCYWVQSQILYWTGSAWSPVVPSYPNSTPHQVRYSFHPFYYPFARLFWNQLSAGGFDLFYDPNLQRAPDSIDPSYSDVFSFQNGYQPTAIVQWDHATVTTALATDIDAVQSTITVENNIWIPMPAFYATIGTETVQVTGVGGPQHTSWTVVRGQQGTTNVAAAAGSVITPAFASQDRQFLDFSFGGAFSVYNWELFYHIPLYIAQLLSQNQQFEDAQTWFHYIFDPTRQGSEPAPQRFWIPKPLHDLTSTQIQSQQINALLMAVNQGDAAAMAQVQLWRKNPFDPFLLADQRPIAYMKSAVMSYLDNIVAWADNLFASESREALSEATLLYVVAAQMLGPTPAAVIPPPHTDESFDQLEPSLDAFANAMVEIENVIGGAGGSGTGGGSGPALPLAQAFYFKIPSNPTLLNYWNTVADRLFKLRNCQNIAGAPLELALFDAPIDPGLLISAQAAGIDLSSVLSDVSAPLPTYRFTALYPQAMEFVSAVRTYGGALLGALEKSDAGALTLLQRTNQQQLLNDANQILDWQVQQAELEIEAATQAVALAQQRFDFNDSQIFANDWETMQTVMNLDAIAINAVTAILDLTASAGHMTPSLTAGVAGIGGTPVVELTWGGHNVGASSGKAAKALKAISDGLDKAATIVGRYGTYQHRQDTWREAAAEASIQIAQTNAQLNGANLKLTIAQKQQSQHQEQIDQLGKEIDLLTNKFTSDGLYDWMAASLSATYFQAYQLAYQMCKQVERAYRFELGIQDSSFIQFGYWDNLHKGLLAGETLNHDLRRMQASYLQQNTRRFELSRFISLGALDAAALQALLVTGSCFFTLPEGLFDNDYPGHYNRRLTRVSMTVVYPSPGRLDNVKATLTLMANQVRVSTDTTTGYAENPVGSDPRFFYNYAAVPQKIAMGNAQDDPGLFVTAIGSNITDQRYVPFENAGAVSSWYLEMRQLNNEIDTSTVGDVVLHLYYTALDGGAAFQQAVEAANTAKVPTSGMKIFSAQNDFAAPPASTANPYPMTPWQAFLTKPFVTATTLAWPIDSSQTNITVVLDVGFPPPPFLVNIGSEILQVTAVGGPRNTSWTVTRGQQGAQASPAAGQAVVLLPSAGGSQALILSLSPSKFPPWTRGKTISVTAMTLLAVSWQPPSSGPGPFVLVPLAPLPTAPITMQPVPGSTEPNVCTSGPISLPPNTSPGTWGFELQLLGGTDFVSLSKNSLGDIFLLVSYQAS
jgi:hypothetical protein